MLMLRRISFMTVLLSALAMGGLEAAPAPDYGQLLAAQDKALVTVKFVLQVKLGGSLAGGLADQELENEVTGIVIDAKGLVLCSNTQFNAYVDLMRQMMPAGAEMTATPKDLKILTGTEGEELEADLLVRDSDRDLVWLRIREPGERKFSFIDFAQAAVPGVGDEVFAIWRMDRYFARTPTLSHVRIGGITQRPRHLFIPDAALSAGIGAPVFDRQGKVVGMTVSQLPDSGANGATENPFAMMTESLRMQQGVQGLILPAAEIAKATQQVLAMDEEEAP